MGEIVLLKSLELNGFKTFPDKINLSFNNGITAIVGPNGSGKSNISDAIRWVLGEQSIKNLRCSKMEDVIFNGTPIRKSKGFAEVKLVFENLSRQLPFDSDEVNIVRRYYRSGESEYLVNGSLVRLKDIHELFMDTGLGRDGYSIIGQGKIDSVVSSKSEDRREIFEEAAGISRYRYRKAESEKKLKQADENLIRIKDITIEIEGRLKPLKEQSEKAKVYLEYSSEKRNLEIGLWLNTLDKYENTISQQESKILIFRNEYNEIDKCLEEIQNKIDNLFNNSSLYAVKIEELRKNLAYIDENSTLKLNEISILENNILHNCKNIDRIKSEIEQFSQSSLDVQNLLDSKKEKIDKCSKTISDSKQLLDDLVKQFNLSKCKTDNISLEIDNLYKELSSIKTRASEAKSVNLNAMYSIGELEERLTKLKDEKLSVEKTISRLESEFNLYKENKLKSKSILEDLSESVNKCELKLNDRQKLYEQLKKKSNKLELELGDKLRKLKLLDELEKSMDGFSRSVKEIIKESNNKKLLGIHGPVSKLLEVPERYSIAIEIALGASAQNVIVNNEEDAKNAINFLKVKNAGRATFLPISTIKGNSINDLEIKHCNGYIGVASHLCSCDDKYCDILKALLGKVIVVDNLDNAILISKNHRNKFKIVTLDGQVVNTWGSLTGGSVLKGSGLISRVSEINKIKLEVEHIQKDYLIAKKEVESLNDEILIIKDKFISLRNNLYKAQEDYLSVESKCKSYESEICLHKKSICNYEQDTNEIKQKLCELNEFKELHVVTYQKFLSNINDVEKLIDVKTKDREKLLANNDSVFSEIQNKKLNILSYEKDMQSLNTEITSLKNQKITQDEKIKNLILQVNNFKKENECIDKQISVKKEEIEKAKIQNNNLKIEIEKLTNERILMEKDSIDMRKKEKEKSVEKEVVVKELSRLEEQKINLQKEYDTIIKNLWDEYELTRREARSSTKKINDLQLAKRRLDELKLKIRSLGTINVSAIDEYKELLDRYNFLINQVKDIENVKKELSGMISDLTTQMKKIFLERFQEINKNFSSIFSQLFGGGNASLSLIEPDNILNSGIDIIVQPPGKIISYLESLSGGEKSLIAIALYFSIMKVSPPPFCVLDEIEASLDDVNVDRFASYLHNISDKTQFIVITHRRGTMEEADTLYGITMQDEGVSKILELRAYEVEQKLGI